MLLIPIIYSEYSKNETNSNVNKKTIRSKNLKQRLSNYVDQIHFGINNHNNLVSNRSFDLVLKGLERLVHIDLKGAPPRLEYFRKLFPFLKDHGATGILLEYEDMFPFTGVLQEARHGNAYSLNDIIMIRQIARENGMYIVPLIQTYGHLEWLLKVKTFAHLREDYKYPQVITPCLEETYAILFG
jgi:hexosaminidase